MRVHAPSGVHYRLGVPEEGGRDVARGARVPLEREPRGHGCLVVQIAPVPGAVPARRSQRAVLEEAVSGERTARR
jgi:hypothetical protein